jgi:fructose-1-phosphate kinase PfkB-like protein
MAQQSFMTMDTVATIAFGGVMVADIITRIGIGTTVIGIIGIIDSFWLEISQAPRLERELFLISPMTRISSPVRL